jgi:hypothetical protein
MGMRGESFDDIIKRLAETVRALESGKDSKQVEVK